MALGYYAWTDLEMTGLDKKKAEVCEIACIITDPHTLEELGVFTKIVDQRNAYWEHQALAMHQKNGLYEEMARGCRPDAWKEPFKKFLNANQMIDARGEPVQYHIAGSAIWFDLTFLIREFGEEYAMNIFSHRPMDVSTIKLEVRATNGDDVANQFNHQGKDLMSVQHRALDDIRYSINQLKWFRKMGQIGGQHVDNTFQ